MLQKMLSSVKTGRNAAKGKGDAENGGGKVGRCAAAGVFSCVKMAFLPCDMPRGMVQSKAYEKGVIVLKPQIINIINFIRAVEPREPALDLLLPVQKQIELMAELGLSGTFLLQYDALCDERYTMLLKQAENIEIGLWFEIPRPLAEAAGLVWRGRPGFDWDWYANVGFSVGYTPAEREKIIDVMMGKFHAVFGRYPQSVGSWLIDAHSLLYMKGKYGITASCNCKDQWGTDGYTLWGGYYGQAYYPSRLNAYTPAQTKANQIDVPVFKMLGSDPIYQYDLGLDLAGAPDECQKVVTLEPIYKGDAGGGGEPDWVDWYFRENYNGVCIHFAYAQAGQENSFGWPRMCGGIMDQFHKIAALAAEGEVQVMTLAESGAWFAAQFDTTPPTAIAAFSDWKGRAVQSLWFNAARYRVNWYAEQDMFWIRDWHVFDERYAERYLNAVCDKTYLVYDNLPVMDGNRWSGGNVRAGIYPVNQEGMPLRFANVSADDSVGALRIGFDGAGGAFSVVCHADSLAFQYVAPFELRFAAHAALPLQSCTPDRAVFAHNGYAYALCAEYGRFVNDGRFQIVSDVCGRLVIRIETV